MKLFKRNSDKSILSFHFASAKILFCITDTVNFYFGLVFHCTKYQTPNQMNSVELYLNLHWNIELLEKEFCSNLKRKLIIEKGIKPGGK